MQSSNLRPMIALAAASIVFAACGRDIDTYADIPNPPLLKATLHAVTLASDEAAFAERLRDQGYRPLVFPSNYPDSTPVEAVLWEVPEAVAAKVAQFTAPSAQAPDVRLLILPLAARGLTADSKTENDFFRRVLGVDVPRWPASGNRPANVRIQAWTYVIPNLPDANRRLRASGIPVIFDPVTITTAYLGAHRTMAIRAPDGTVVELVETAAQ